MYVKILLTICASCLLSCHTGNQGSTQKEELIDPTVIDLSEALDNIVDKVNLSEFVDSIRYVPLETISESLLRGGCIATGNYLTSFRKYFDKDGHFLCSLGQKGQGAYDDIYAEYANVIFLSGHFYANAQKTIEYDMDGKCTKKVRTNYEYDLRQQDVIPKNGKANIYGFGKAGKNMMYYYFPDSIAFYDTAFVRKACVPIMQWDWGKYPQPYIGYNSFVSSYRDTTLFYFYY